MAVNKGMMRIICHLTRVVWACVRVFPAPCGGGLPCVQALRQAAVCRQGVHRRLRACGRLDAEIGLLRLRSAARPALSGEFRCPVGMGGPKAEVGFLGQRDSQLEGTAYHPFQRGGADRGMYFIWDFTQLNVRPHSRVGLLKYKTAPKCSLSGPFRHSGVGRNPGVVGPVRSYNLNFTYPCQPLAGG